MTKNTPPITYETKVESTGYEPEVQTAFDDFMHAFEDFKLHQ